MSIREDVPARKHQRSITPMKLAVIAGTLIAVFLLGYIPARMSARNAQELNVRLQYELRLGNLEGHLGMASYEANQNNYANAAQHSTRFFSGLHEAIDDTSDETLKRNLERILAQRDEITANIAEANPAVKEKLAQAYADFFQLTTARKNLQDASLSGNGTEDEIRLLQRLQFEDRRPTALFYYRELQNLRDPLHFENGRKARS